MRRLRELHAPFASMSVYLTGVDDDQALLSVVDALQQDPCATLLSAVVDHADFQGRKMQFTHPAIAAESPEGMTVSIIESPSLEVLRSVVNGSTRIQRVRISLSYDNTDLEEVDVTCALISSEAVAAGSNHPIAVYMVDDDAEGIEIDDGRMQVLRSRFITLVDRIRPLYAAFDGVDSVPAPFDFRSDPRWRFLDYYLNSEIVSALELEALHRRGRNFEVVDSESGVVVFSGGLWRREPPPPPESELGRQLGEVRKVASRVVSRVAWSL